jgi:predicted phage terminase large subunit-like protein
VRLRGRPEEVERSIVNTAGTDGRKVKISLPQDPGQAGKVQALAHTRMLAGYRLDVTPESGDKATRAGPFAAQCNGGNVAFVRSPWNAALIEEMRSFPSGRHDDQVDACSRAFSRLIAPPAPPTRRPINIMGR